MAYSVETLKKYTEIMKEKIVFYRTIANDNSVHVTISEGNKKIGNTLNVSTAPIFTCSNCSGCKKLCYDIKANMAYKNVMEARAKNTAIMLENRKKYFADIITAIEKRKKNQFFRWHVAGDIPDYEYFCNMVAIAIMFPTFRFWTYTKNYYVVNEYCRKNGKASIPENLSVMFSEWKGMPMTNPYNFPVFSVVFKDEEKPHNVKWCCGNCNICIKNCSHCVKGETVYCMEH